MGKWTAGEIVIAACAGICVALGLIVAPIASGSVWIPLLIGVALIAMLIRTRRQRAGTR